MAEARRDRGGIFPEVAGRRSARVLVMALIAVLAAIALIWSISRRTAHRSAPAIVEVEPVATPPVEVPEPAPAAAPAPAPVEESAASARDQLEISRVIGEGRPALKTCYQRALVRDDSLVHGKVIVRLSIAASGRVDNVRVAGPAGFRALQPCFEEVISRWSFPAAAAPYAAEFPIVLQGRQ
jgi:TonB family protein